MTVGASPTFAVAIGSPPAPPSLTGTISERTYTEQTGGTATIDVTDAFAGDDLSYSLTSPPAWASISGGVITIELDDAVATTTLTVVADSEHGDPVQTTVDVTINEAGAYDPGDVTDYDLINIAPRYAYAGTPVRAAHVKNLFGTPATDYTWEWVTVNGSPQTVTDGVFKADRAGVIAGVVSYGGTRYNVGGEAYDYIPLRADALFADYADGDGIAAGIPPYPDPGAITHTPADLAEAESICNNAPAGSTIIFGDFDFTGQGQFAPPNRKALTVISKNLHGCRFDSVRAGSPSDFIFQGFRVNELCEAPYAKGPVWFHYIMAQTIRVHGSNSEGPVDGYHRGMKITCCVSDPDKAAGQWSIYRAVDGEFCQNIIDRSTSGDLVNLANVGVIRVERNVFRELDFIDSEDHMDLLQIISSGTSKWGGEFNPMGHWAFNVFGDPDKATDSHTWAQGAFMSTIGTSGNGETMQDVCAQFNLCTQAKGNNGLVLDRTSRNVCQWFNSSNRKIEMNGSNSVSGSQYSYRNVGNQLTTSPKGLNVENKDVAEGGSVTANFPNINGSERTVDNWFGGDASFDGYGADWFIKDLEVAKAGGSPATAMPSGMTVE